MSLTKQQKTRLTVVALVVHAVGAALTVRDISARPDDQVRGPKKIWMAWSVSNTSGQVAYWAWGRKRQCRDDKCCGN